MQITFSYDLPLYLQQTLDLFLLHLSVSDKPCINICMSYLVALKYELACHFFFFYCIYQMDHGAILTAETTLNQPLWFYWTWVVWLWCDFCMMFLLFVCMLCTHVVGVCLVRQVTDACRCSHHCGGQQPSAVSDTGGGGTALENNHRPRWEVKHKHSSKTHAAPCRFLCLTCIACVDLLVGGGIVLD